MRQYLSHHQAHISAVTVMERVRGYSLMWQHADGAKREHIEATMVSYPTSANPIQFAEVRHE